MKHKLIPSSIGLGTIILLFILSAIFIFLSTKSFNEEVPYPAQLVEIKDKKYDWWRRYVPREKHADVMFNYDERQEGKVQVINYDVVESEDMTEITQEEITVLLDCYKNNICKKKQVSLQVAYIIDHYKYFIDGDNIVIYGLVPSSDPESLLLVESHVFVVGDSLFTDIANPIFSKTNQKYIAIQESDTDIKSNFADIQKEISQEQSQEVQKDLEILKEVANSVKLKYLDE